MIKQKVKNTYLNKHLDWILIIISFASAIAFIGNLLKSFEFVSSYLLRIIYAQAAVTSFVSLIQKDTDGTRYSKYFVIIIFIFPAISIINQFLTHILFYDIARLNLFLNPFIFFKLIIGITLLFFCIKYSKKSKPEQLKDYAVLIMLVGLYLITLTLIKSLEANIRLDLNRIPLLETTIEGLLGLSIIFSGFRFKKGRTKPLPTIIMTSLLISIYSLV